MMVLKRVAAATAGVLAVSALYASAAQASPSGGAQPAASAPSSAHGGSSPRELTAVSTNIAAASFSRTNCWGGVSDGVVLPWFGAPVVAQQPVAVTASEANASGIGEFLGAANVYSEGVAVQDSAVQVRVHTGWGSPITVCIHFIG